MMPADWRGKYPWRKSRAVADQPGWYRIALSQYSGDSTGSEARPMSHVKETRRGIHGKAPSGGQSSW
jgi:hypothetical protein